MTYFFIALQFVPLNIYYGPFLPEMDGEDQVQCQGNLVVLGSTRLQFQGGTQAGEETQTASGRSVEIPASFWGEGSCGNPGSTAPYREAQADPRSGNMGQILLLPAPLRDNKQHSCSSRAD